jgi:hypothetical protein
MEPVSGRFVTYNPSYLGFSRPYITDSREYSLGAFYLTE